MRSHTTIEADLVTAAAGIFPISDVEPWDYGWAYENYRRSPNPAMSSPNGPVSLAGEHLDAYERATNALIREPAVRDRWHSEELWSIVGSLVVVASAHTNCAAFVAGAVERLREVAPSLVVTLVANAKWDGVPAAVGNAAIGVADDRLFSLLDEVANERIVPTPEDRVRWFEQQINNRPGDLPPVAFATWVSGQGALANDQASRRMGDLIGICLLLETDLRGRGIYRRGFTNRPGVRGLRLDRGAVGAGMRKAARIELASEPMVISEMYCGSGISWYGAEPLPLSELVSRPATRKALAVLLASEDPVSQSLRVAARWFTEAHYAEAEEDAALALGVALDAMLTGKRALPGSAMADRYALLSPNPDSRKELVAQYLKLYGVRSSVAHGGRTSKLDDPTLLTDYISVVQETAHRCIALRDRFKPNSPADVDDVFDSLRWGTRTW